MSERGFPALTSSELPGAAPSQPSTTHLLNFCGIDLKVRCLDRREDDDGFLFDDGEGDGDDAEDEGDPEHSGAVGDNKDDDARFGEGRVEEQDLAEDEGNSGSFSFDHTGE